MFSAAFTVSASDVTVAEYVMVIVVLSASAASLSLSNVTVRVSPSAVVVLATTSAGVTATSLLYWSPALMVSWNT